MIKLRSICTFVTLIIAVCLLSGCQTTTQNHSGIVKYRETPKQEKKGTVETKELTKEAIKDYEQIQKGWYADIIPYTLRDFEIKGIVFVESKVTIDVNGERTGSEITNYMLMKEAEKLGADDVINIKIDEKEESEVVDSYNTKQKFLKRKYKKTSYIYQATALAIKYTNAIYGDKATVESKNEITISPTKDIEKQEEPKTIKQQTKLKK